MRFRSDSLRSVGIHDGGQCWAVWTPMHEDQDRGPSSTGSLGRYHLVISPFHPVSWPFLVRIRIRLTDSLGVLAQVSAGLRHIKIADHLRARGRNVSDGARDGLNILHQDQAPTGFGHCTWTIVAEVMAVRAMHQRRKEELDAHHPEPRGQQSGERAGDDSVHSRAAAFKEELSIDMQYAVDAIRRHLRALAKANPEYLRVGAHLPSGDSLGEIQAGAGDRDHRIARIRWRAMHIPKAFHVRGLYELPFHAVYGGGSGAPFGMRYVGSNRELRFDRAIDYPGASAQRQVLLPDKPHLAIATFDPSEHLLRVVPMPDELRDRRAIVVEVDYDIRARGVSWPGLSKGLVNAVAEIARTYEFSIVSILNKMLEVSTREERGTLRIVAVCATPMERPKHVRRMIREAIEKIGRPDDVPRAKMDRRVLHDAPAAESRDATSARSDQAACEAQKPVFDLNKCYVTIKARCTAPAVHQLFISMNFRHRRHENIAQLISKACGACGFEPVFAESYSDTATSLVLKKIESCDAFLQLLVEPRDDKPRRRSWLDFEYGAACGRDLPRMRLVDTSVRSYEKWSEIIDIDRDRYCKDIDLSLGDKELLEAFKRAIREISRRSARG
ncbi:MAG: hypothetical protein U1F36_05650 [Planctomycetota bacterium]